MAENETEEEEGESAQPSSESTSHGQNYFSWSSTGEEEEDGAVEGNDQEWGPTGASSKSKPQKMRKKYQNQMQMI